MLWWIPDAFPGLPAFFAGALIGVFSVLVKYYFDNRQRKREYTTSLILNLNINQFLAPMEFRAFQLAQQGVDLGKDLSPSDAQAVEQTLDYLEFLAICHHQGLVDTETLVRQEGMPIIVLFDAAKPWIDEYRTRSQSGSVYIELERMVDVVRKRRKRIYGHLQHQG